MSNPSVGDKARYAAERVMEPILRRWFAIDLDPVNLDSNAENAAVDLSWALESAGLLLPIELVVPEGVPEDHRVCSHGIYHHGCPSCDRQDPEDR